MVFEYSKLLECCVAVKIFVLQNKSWGLKKTHFKLNFLLRRKPEQITESNYNCDSNDLYTF